MSLSMSEKWICFEFFRPSLASIQRRERERERERCVGILPFSGNTPPLIVA
jgi:hypothetical protein